MRMRSSVLGFVGLVVVVACAPASIEAGGSTGEEFTAVNSYSMRLACACC